MQRHHRCVWQLESMLHVHLEDLVFRLWFAAVSFEDDVNWRDSVAVLVDDPHADFGARVPAIQCAVHLYPIDGAVQRVGADETAFAYRDVDFSPVIAGMWEDPADNDANIAWVRAYHQALEPYSAEGGYINFMDGDDQARVQTNYRGNYERLASVKSTYDPTNLFHLNQNIRPAD